MISSGSTPGSPHVIHMPVKYLEYTDHSGHKIILGLDNDGIPLTKMTQITAAEYDQLGKDARENSDIPGGPKGMTDGVLDQ